MKTVFITESGAVIYRANIRTYNSVARAIKAAIEKGVNTLLAKDEDRNTCINYTSILRERMKQSTSKAA